MKIETKRRERPDGLQCLYCRGPLEKGETQRCTGCEAVYHTECLHQELGSVCATPGCGQKAFDVTTRPKGDCRCGQELPNAALSRCTGCGRANHTGCLQQAGGCCLGAGSEEVQAGTSETPTLSYWEPTRSERVGRAGLLVILGLAGVLLVGLVAYGVATDESTKALLTGGVMLIGLLAWIIDSVRGKAGED